MIWPITEWIVRMASFSGSRTNKRVAIRKKERYFLMMKKITLKNKSENDHKEGELIQILMLERYYSFQVLSHPPKKKKMNENLNERERERKKKNQGEKPLKKKFLATAKGNN